MPRFTRKRGGAPHAAYKTKTASRKVLANRNRRGSRAAATLENMGVTFRRSYVPPNTKKTRTRAATEAPRKSLRAVKLAVTKASRQAANAYAKAKANTAAAAKKAQKAAAEAEEAEEAEMERLREANLVRIVTKNHPVIAPSSLTHPAEHARHVKNYNNAMKELKGMRNNRSTKSRAQKNRGNAPNLGRLSLGAPLSTINENNAPDTPRYR